MVRSRTAALLIVISFFLFASSIEASVYNCVGTKCRGNSSSVSSRKAPVISTKKPLCDSKEEKWICSQWSACTYGTDVVWLGKKGWGAGWVQTRTCKSDPSNKCIGRGAGPNKQVCQPTQKQQATLDAKLQAESDKKKAETQLLQNAENLKRLKDFTINMYDSMSAMQESMDSSLTLFVGSTSNQLFELSSQHAALQKKLKPYKIKAEIDILLLSDFEAVAEIVDEATSVAKRFNTIMKSVLE